MFQRWKDPEKYWMGRLQKGATKAIRKIESLGLSHLIIPAIGKLALSVDWEDSTSKGRVSCLIQGYARESSAVDKMTQVRSLLETLLFETLDARHIRRAGWEVMYYARTFGIPEPNTENLDKLCRMLLIMDGSTTVLKWEGDHATYIVPAIKSAILSIGHKAAPTLLSQVLRCKDYFASYEFPADSIQTLRLLDNGLAMPFVLPLLRELERAVITATEALSHGVKVTTYSNEHGDTNISGNEYLYSLEEVAKVLATVGNSSDIPAILSQMRRSPTSVSVTKEGTFRNQVSSEINPIHAELHTLVDRIVKNDPLRL